MKFFTAIISGFVALAAAQPSARSVAAPKFHETASPLTVRLDGRDVEVRSVTVGESSVQIEICSNILNCAVALAPAVVTCAKAVAKEGKDPLEDAACLAAAVNAGVNVPNGCQGCF